MLQTRFADVPITQPLPLIGQPSNKETFCSQRKSLNCRLPSLPRRQLFPHIFAYNPETGSPAIAECTSNAAPHMQPEGTNTQRGAPLAPYSLALVCSAHIRHPSVTEQCVYQMINATKEPADPCDQKRIASEWSNEMRTKGTRITMQAAITNRVGHHCEPAELGTITPRDQVHVLVQDKKF